MFQSRISSLRQLMREHCIQAYIVPSTDEWMNEYTPLNRRRLEWICGFSGSNGVLIVTHKNLTLLTDGRYIAQARMELSNEYTVLDMHHPNLYTQLSQYFNNGDVIGYDPMLHTKKVIDYYNDLGKKFNFSTQAIDVNLIDILCQQTDGMTANHRSSVMNLSLTTAGVDVATKLDCVISAVQKSSDYFDKNYLILTSPASICWLLNIRGNDVQYNPLILCYAVISLSEKNIMLFIDDTIVELVCVNYHSISYDVISNFKSFFTTIGQSEARIYMDLSSTPIWFVQNATNITDIQDPTLLLRAIKNPVELDGIITAHVYDGVAVCKFWYWLYEQITAQKYVDEMSASEMLRIFRAQQPTFYSESFATISAYASNGAIVHYYPKVHTNKRIDPKDKNPIYLLDSGGQYTCAGTTDITRVFDISSAADCINENELRQEHKKVFTLVLKSHIALASAVFPVGTTGGQLDVLARYYLWKNGLDYGHGTGHGVGHFLCVHEGPHAISKCNNIPLVEGMIVSIEPGYYKENNYGMRIENLYTVRKSRMYEGFLYFDLLTTVPIESSLVDMSMMHNDEIIWFNMYNNSTLERVCKHLSAEEISFMKNRCTLEKIKLQNI